MDDVGEVGALGLVPSGARVHLALEVSLDDILRVPTEQRDGDIVEGIKDHRAIQPYSPVGGDRLRTLRTLGNPGDSGSGSVPVVFESVTAVFEDSPPDAAMDSSNGRSISDLRMSDADAQVQPFVEFELSCFVPPRRDVDPTPRLPGEPRVKGRVVFHYLYHKRRMRKTELTVGFTCPFCTCVNVDFAGLSQHLEACHDAFNFEFLPKVQNEPDPRVHVVCKSELAYHISTRWSESVRKQTRSPLPLPSSPMFPWAKSP